MTIVGNWFRSVLAPVRAEEFLNTSWESASLVVPGTPGKFGGLDFDFERFALALEEAPPGAIKASSVTADGEGSYVTIEAARARSCFDQGMTICITGIDRQVPELGSLARDTQRALGLAGAVLCNCYLSPEGTGF